MIKKINRMARRVLSTMMKINKKDNLLDVGSGDGYWTNQFASIAGNVVGVDPDQNLLEMAREHYSKSNLCFDEGVAENLPYEDNTFDKVVSVSVVEHFNDPIAGKAEMGRVLKPKGVLAMSVYSLQNDNSSDKSREFHKK